MIRSGGHLEGEGLCEISPLLSYSGEGLDHHLSGKVIKLPAHLTPESVSHLTTKSSI